MTQTSPHFQKRRWLTALSGDAQELIIQNFKLRLWVISTSEEIYHTQTTTKQQKLL